MEQNYLPLFRKYRPQSFKDIVGQEHLVKALCNAIELNRIANAYLFCGPRGTGKTSTARILAKSLNCEHGPTIEPCQKCASCVDITNTTGLDVIEIDAASNRGIQDAKELIAQVQYAPINGKYKIFIIDEVHMLSTDAFNALLKTFEEPPENVIFILATTEPHKVLETIVSRCQRFDLRRITVDDIVKKLREISNLEKIKITDSALYTIAKNVSGGLRDSLALLDQVSILGVKEEIDKDLIEELLGKVNFDILLNLLNDIYNEDIEKTITDINEIYKKGNEPRNLSENFMEFLRNIILVLNSNNVENIINFTNLIKDDIDKIKNMSFDKNKVIKILDIFIEYYKEIKVSTNPYLWVELAGIASCKLNSTPATTQQIKQNQIQPNKIEAVKKEIAKQEIKKEEPIKQEPKVQEIKQEAINEPIKQETQAPSDIWLNILNKIVSYPSKAFFTNIAKLVDIKDNKITLGFLHDNTLEQAKSPTKFNQLQDAIKSIYPEYKAEFIKINANTKTIEIQTKKQPFRSNVQINKPINVQPTNTKEEKQEEIVNEPESQEEKIQQAQYNQEVRDMIEQYNGRIIE